MYRKGSLILTKAIEPSQKEGIEMRGKIFGIVIEQLPEGLLFYLSTSTLTNSVAWPSFVIAVNVTWTKAVVKEDDIENLAFFGDADDSSGKKRLLPCDSVDNRATSGHSATCGNAFDLFHVAAKRERRHFIYTFRFPLVTYDMIS